MDIDITKTVFLVGPNRVPLAGPVEDYLTIKPLVDERLRLVVMDASEEEFASALASTITISCGDNCGKIFIGTAIITDDNRVVATNHKGQRAVMKITPEAAAKARAST